MIELAKLKDLDTLVKIASYTRNDMIRHGLNQWLGNYPSIDYFKKDYKDKGLYVYLIDGEIVASISILPENESAYKELTWLKDNSLVIHRLLVNPDYQNRGIAKELFQFAINKAKKENYQSIKIDTHPDNFKMQKLILKFDFKKIGYLSKINRLAYELVL